MEGKIFDWTSLLKSSNFEAANVSLFKLAPCAKLWNECVVPGVKFVARHYQANPARRSLVQKASFWVVTVMKVQGYFALVRFLGLGRDATQDFWIHMGKHEIYPVGKEMQTAIFMPPTCLLGRAQDWRTYFCAHLPGSITLPSELLSQLRESRSTRAFKYKIGDNLEVLDKYNVSQYRVGRVKKVVGGRMYLHYADEDNDDGFFSHEQSSLVHSLGWATCVGHKLKVPADDYLSLSTKPVGPATDSDSEGEEIKEGMKLEAVDPQCPSRICAATICKVLKFGYIMIKMDCSDDKQNNNGLDEGKISSINDIPDAWFCYHVQSPYIFKCGFCKRYGITIVPPVGYEMNKFTWTDYLKGSGKMEAPLPEKPKLKHGFKTFMKLEMANLLNPAHIHPATVIQVAGRLLRIRFDGWEPVYDQWLDVESPDIYPIGWSALVGHTLLDPPK